MAKWLVFGTIAIGTLCAYLLPHAKVNTQALISRSSGAADLASDKIHLLRIPFATAKIELSSNGSRSLRWDCKSTATARQPRVNVVAGVATLDLASLTLAKCLVSLPEGTATEIKGVNGHMEIRRPASALDVKLSNGKVIISTDPARDYDFDVTVKNGLQDFFPRSSNQSAVKVKVSLINGTVKKE